MSEQGDCSVTRRLFERQV